jgi:hypothetical protein
MNILLGKSDNENKKRCRKMKIKRLQNIRRYNNKLYYNFCIKREITPIASHLYNLFR